jgi:hypothetical protein
MDIEVTQQPFDLQMELYELQSDPFFNLKNESPEYWKILPQKKFPKLRSVFLEMLSLFGSTYVCEAAFSTMNIIRSRVRNRLDDSSLESCLRLSLTGLPIDTDKLAAQKQAQGSH